MKGLTIFLSLAYCTNSTLLVFDSECDKGPIAFILEVCYLRYSDSSLKRSLLVVVTVTGSKMSSRSGIDRFHSIDLTNYK